MPEDAGGGLQPPVKDGIEDPGAHDLESSDSDDHFSDAQTGLQDQSRLNSPIPTTRVERVDTQPSHGEVPGTDAYNVRIADATPDEIAVISGAIDGNREGTHASSRPSTPGGHPIPTTIVEKVDSSSPSRGETPGTHAYDMHKADALPDSVRQASENGENHENDALAVQSASDDIPAMETALPVQDGTEKSDGKSVRTNIASNVVESDVQDSQISSSTKSPTISHSRRKSSSAKKSREMSESQGEEAEADGGFGDDFDDFEEGDEDAEFGDFDDGFENVETTIPQPQHIQPVTPSFPVLNLDGLDSSDEILAVTEPYINALFPSDSINISVVPTPSNAHPVFLTQRSASLWSQLVAPPPLQPPNWIRSRIRRLFLVSLGVPVDLDEILPASKQKKLVLPSTSLRASFSSSRASMDAATGDSIARLKSDDANASNTSLDSQGKPTRTSSKRRRGPPPAPELDLVYARQLCTITDEALAGLTVEELKEHVEKLESMQGLAKEVLDYWTQRTDEKIGDREAFEGVIENLVKHARKVRK